MHARQYLSALLLATFVLTGCELAGFVAGRGKQKALHKFEKTQRVVVLVDAREGVSLPPNFNVSLAEKIGAHLYTNKAVESLVSVDRVFEFEQRNPAAFKKMNIGEITRGVDADFAVYVYLTRVVTTTSVDGTVVQGDAELFAKVIDREGNRVWPMDTAGARIVANVDPTFTSDKKTADLLKELADLLTLRTGRMFHDYPLNDHYMTR